MSDIDWNDNAKAAVRGFADWLFAGYAYLAEVDDFLKEVSNPQTKTVADAVKQEKSWKVWHCDYLGYNLDTQNYVYGSREKWADHEQFVCTREQFEAYAKEQEAKQEGEKWTHNNPPPVGTKCKYRLNSSDRWFECEIVSHNRLVIRCPHLASGRDAGLQLVGVTSTVDFKPIKPTITKAEHEFLCKFAADVNNIQVVAEVESYLANHDIVK